MNTEQFDQADREITPSFLNMVLPEEEEEAKDEEKPFPIEEIFELMHDPLLVQGSWFIVPVHCPTKQTFQDARLALRQDNVPNYFLYQKKHTCYIIHKCFQYAPLKCKCTALKALGRGGGVRTCGYPGG